MAAYYSCPSSVKSAKCRMSSSDVPGTILWFLVHTYSRKECSRSTADDLFSHFFVDFSVAWVCHMWSWMSSRRERVGVAPPPLDPRSPQSITVMTTRPPPRHRRQNHPPSYAVLQGPYTIRCTSYIVRRERRSVVRARVCKIIACTLAHSPN